MDQVRVRNNKGNALYYTGVAIPYLRHRCRKYTPIFDTAPCVIHTPRITFELPRLFSHSEELWRKLSSAENSPVLNDIQIHRVLVHLRNIQRRRK